MRLGNGHELLEYLKPQSQLISDQSALRVMYARNDFGNLEASLTCDHALIRTTRCMIGCYNEMMTNQAIARVLNDCKRQAALIMEQGFLIHDPLLIEGDIDGNDGETTILYCTVRRTKPMTFREFATELLQRIFNRTPDHPLIHAHLRPFLSSVLFMQGLCRRPGDCKMWIDEL